MNEHPYQASDSNSVLKPFSQRSVRSGMSFVSLRRTILPATDEAATKLPVDEDGAPVTLEAKDWLICFVPGLRPQWWHPFVHKTHKHVFALRPNEDGSWMLFEPWWSRLLVSVITTEQALQFLRWAAMGDALLVREAIPGKGSQMRGWANCTVLATFLLGRSYRVWSPDALYRKLKCEADVKHVDLDVFVGQHLYHIASRYASKYCLFLSNGQSFDLDRALRDFGRAFLRAAVSNEILGICRSVFAVDEKLPSAARRFWEGGSRVAEAALAAMFDTVTKRGTVDINDSTTAARRFLGLLRGGVLHEVLLGLRSAPADEEIDEIVNAAVDLFLNGTAKQHLDFGKQQVPTRSDTGINMAVSCSPPLTTRDTESPGTQSEKTRMSI